MTIVKLDGIRMKLNNPDLDKDGRTGDIENITRHNMNETQVNQPTELGEAMKDLDNDDLDGTTRMSNIDTRSRLSILEINSLWAIDSLVAMKFLPSSCLPISRQRKRLTVSLTGLGRKERVQMTIGQRDQAAKEGQGGIGDKIKGFFGG